MRDRFWRPDSLIVLATFVGALVAAACATGPSQTPPPEVPAGNPARGVALIERYGCGGCHIIPGVPGADGKVGPPLIHWGERSYIAGQLPNNAENLVLWIMNPQTVEPGTAMPNLGITRDEALDIAAYLFTLE